MYDDKPIWERYGLTTARAVELRDFVRWLAFECPGANYTPPDNMYAAIAAKVREIGLTIAEFRFLDEKPGHFGYHQTRDGVEAEWFWKLRRARNEPGSGLFTAIEENRNVANR